ncbi:MAG: nickel transporter, partial [Rhizobiaceae bacterium]|nr:nickel transporter [Rhizobiaceae bacterium]
MKIIPVLDIKGGVVVRGVMGDRANYRPIETPLSPTAAPLDVARGLSGLADFSALYLADLDAIGGSAPDLRTYEALADTFPGVTLWIDAGVRTEQDIRRLLERPEVVVVAGSETVDGAGVVARVRTEARVVLSLDYRGEAFVGSKEIEDDPALWPPRVIAMTLAKVGSGAGPDMERLATIKRAAGATAVFAAGGVRDEDDLMRLE